MKIVLPCYSIVITLGAESPEHSGVRIGGKITSELTTESDSPEVQAAMDAIESLVLAHACAGVEVASPAYVEGIETAVEACWNNLS